MSDTPVPTPTHAERLGDVLREARTEKGLELADIAERTHVRPSYLAALEAGNYAELPEEVYTKNFLRLYAQTVGLDEARMLQLYNREKSSDDAFDEAPEPVASRPARLQAAPRGGGPRLGGLLTTLILVAVLVGAAVWAFNAFLFNPSRVAPPDSAARNTSAVQADEAGAETPDELDPVEGQAASTDSPPPQGVGGPADGAQGQVLLSVISNPEGAEVSIDNYTLPRTTPVIDMPVTAGDARMLRVSLPGYQPYEGSFDLTFDRNLSVALSPIVPETEPAGAEAGAPAEAETPAPPASEGQIALGVEEASWIEAYAGTGRGAGTTLVYRTVQPGESFVFDLPVYLHVGNAGGIRYSLGGQDRGLLGSSGEVVSRVFQ